MKHLPEAIRERIFQDLGAASMCWSDVEQAGVFDSVKAAAIGAALCDFLLEEIHESA